MIYLSRQGYDTISDSKPGIETTTCSVKRGADPSIDYSYEYSIIKNEFLIE